MYEINIYVPKKTYYDKFGNIVQTWDKYGIDNAVKWQEDGEELYLSFFGSSKLEAEVRMLGFHIPEIHRREDINRLDG